MAKQCPLDQNFSKVDVTVTIRNLRTNILDCMNQRYPTRAIMDDEYFIETTKEYFKQKRNHNTQIQ